MRPSRHKDGTESRKLDPYRADSVKAASNPERNKNWRFTSFATNETESERTQREILKVKNERNVCVLNNNNICCVMFLCVSEDDYVHGKTILQCVVFCSIESLDTL